MNDEGRLHSAPASNHELSLPTVTAAAEAEDREWKWTEAVDRAVSRYQENRRRNRWPKFDLPPSLRDRQAA
jgi:hypothetical protein